MPSRFLGLKSCILDNGSQLRTMSWLIDEFNYDIRKPIPTNSGIPLGGLTNNVDWYFAQLSPLQNQGNITFGITYTAQFTVAKQQAYVNAAASYVFPGRVFIEIPDTGQTFQFPTKIVEPFSTALTGSPNAWENYNVIVPVNIQKSGTMNVWLEPDILNGAIVPPTTEVRVVLFNASLQPVSFG